VSGVNRIHRISWEEVEPPNPYVAKASKDTVIGVVKLEGRIVFLLDLERIVSNLNPALGLRLDDLGEDYDRSTRYRALVADDSALVREMLKDLLEKANFDVEVVFNGKEAWDRLVTLKNKAETENCKVTDFVQVMVSDIEMPVMDGHNLTKRIKDDPAMKNLPGHGWPQSHQAHQRRPGYEESARVALFLAHYGQVAPQGRIRRRG